MNKVNELESRLRKIEQGVTVKTDEWLDYAAKMKELHDKMAGKIGCGNGGERQEQENQCTD